MSYGTSFADQYRQTLSPASGVIGVLVNPGNPNATSDSAMAQAAATSLRLKIHVAHIVAERDLNAAFDDFLRAQATAVLVFPDALFIDARGRLVELAAHHRLPVLYPDRTFVEVGGLMGYGNRCLSRSRHLCRPYSAGREACGPACDPIE